MKRKYEEAGQQQVIHNRDLLALILSFDASPLILRQVSREWKTTIDTYHWCQHVFSVARVPKLPASLRALYIYPQVASSNPGFMSQLQTTLSAKKLTKFQLKMDQSLHPGQEVNTLTNIINQQTSLADITILNVLDQRVRIDIVNAVHTLYITHVKMMEFNTNILASLHTLHLETSFGISNMCVLQNLTSITIDNVALYDGHATGMSCAHIRRVDVSFNKSTTGRKERLREFIIGLQRIGQVGIAELTIRTRDRKPLRLENMDCFDCMRLTSIELDNIVPWNKGDATIPADTHVMCQTARTCKVDFFPLYHVPDQAEELRCTVPGSRLASFFSKQPPPRLHRLHIMTDSIMDVKAEKAFETFVSNRSDLQVSINVTSTRHRNIAHTVSPVLSAVSVY